MDGVTSLRVVADTDDDIPPLATRVRVAVRSAHLLERVAAIDNGSELARCRNLGKLLKVQGASRPRSDHPLQQASDAAARSDSTGSSHGWKMKCVQSERRTTKPVPSPGKRLRR